jgi:hypothetical protein
LARISVLEEKIVELVVADLAPEERTGGIAYLAAPRVNRGTRLQLPRLVIDVPQPSWLAFIDGKPNSDWGHACRYLLIDDETGQILPFTAQFPPFHSTAPWRWRVVYRAPALPGTTAST